MKIKCGNSLEDLSRWVDGELKDEQGRSLGAHVESCAFCQKEAMVFRSLNQTLRSSKEELRVSPGFETSFWMRVSDRQGIPWVTKLLENLETLLPMPNLRQAVAFSILAFFIGNIGGIVSGLERGMFVPAPSTVDRHFLGVQEFKGVASYSLAGAYLSTVETGGSR